jgi:hypothetical protein
VTLFDVEIDEELYDPHLHVTYHSSGQKSLSHIKICSLRRLIVNFVTRAGGDDAAQFLFWQSILSHFLEHVVTLCDIEIDGDRLEAALGRRPTRVDMAFSIAKMLPHMSTRLRSTILIDGPPFWSGRHFMGRNYGIIPRQGRPSVGELLL